MVSLLATVFVTEAGIMLALSAWGVGNNALVDSVDVFLLVVILGPIFWYRVVRPLGIANDVLRASQQKYRLLAHALQSAGDCISITDTEDHFLYVNETFLRTYGYQEHELIGQHVSMLRSARTPAETGAAVLPATLSGTWSGELWNRSKDGREFLISLEASAVSDEDGRRIALVGIARDISERRRYEEDLIQARTAADAANGAKSEFLANMSHEIRTPMNGIIGMTDLVLDSELTAEQRDNLGTVRTSAESLLSILNDILDFSKIESRQLWLESVPFSIRTTIADALKPLAVRAYQKGLELLCDIDPDVPAGLVGDPTRLQQVLTNLVGNALKFTEHGHIVVAVHEDSFVGGSTKLHFTVTDTGIGIPAEQHEAIFEAFRQADGSTTRRFGGTGLGLTISMTLVRLMGGRLWMESATGAGSTFHFTVALDIGTAPEPRATDAIPPHLDVLILDDNDVNRQILTKEVTHWGMTATAMATGRAGLEALDAAARTNHPFELVLLDANMPEMDGFTVVAAIRMRPELAGVRVIMLTASGGFRDEARCAELGIVEWLTKPVYAADLQAAIHHAFEPRSRALIATAARSRAGTLAMGSGVRAVRILLVEDNAVNRRVALGLLTRRGHHVTVAVNGRDALTRLEDESFDLVLMDLQMPVMGGIEATVAIRVKERETGGHVRVVAMTAHALTTDRERCLAAGMDGYLSKPIDPRALFAMVEQAHGGAPAPALAPARRGAFDEEALRTRLSGDRHLIADVIRVFLEDLPARLSAIDAAVVSRNAVALREAAHDLKGAAGNLSAVGLFDAACVLEHVGAESRMDAAEAALRRLSIEAIHIVNVLRRPGAA
jgi:PAS domain S-box-containing protein